MAALEAVQLAESNNWAKVHFEGDCRVLVEAINTEAECLLPMGALIEELKTRLGCFVFSAFLHVYRAGNTLAHKLATQATCQLDGNTVLSS